MPLPNHIAESLHKAKRRIESIEKMHSDDIEKVFQQTRAVSGILKKMEINEAIELLKNKDTFNKGIDILKKL